MAYHTHADMETLLDLGTLSGSTTPITDTAMDSICTLVEGYAEGCIAGRTGRGLADIASATARKGILLSMSAKYYYAQQAIRAGAASKSTPTARPVTASGTWT